MLVCCKGQGGWAAGSLSCIHPSSPYHPSPRCCKLLRRLRGHYHEQPQDHNSHPLSPPRTILIRRDSAIICSHHFPPPHTSLTVPPNPQSARFDTAATACLDLLSRRHSSPPPPPPPRYPPLPLSLRHQHTSASLQYIPTPPCTLLACPLASAAPQDTTCLSISPTLSCKRQGPRCRPHSCKTLGTQRRHRSPQDPPRRPPPPLEWFPLHATTLRHRYPRPWSSHLVEYLPPSPARPPRLPRTRSECRAHSSRPPPLLRTPCSPRTIHLVYTLPAAGLRGRGVLIHPPLLPLEASPWKPRSRSRQSKCAGAFVSAASSAG